MGPKLNCNTQRRDATSKPEPKLGRLWLTDQTLNLPNLAVIGKPNSTSTTTSYMILLIFTRCPIYSHHLSAWLQPLHSLLFTRPLSSFISLNSYGESLGCLPRSILAADRLSITPDTRLVSVLLHYFTLALSRNNTAVMMAPQPSAPKVVRHDALVGQTRTKPIREPVALT